MTMTSAAARTVFNEVAAAHRANGNHEAAARAEIAREYFTNPNFRKEFEEFVWIINGEGK